MASNEPPSVFQGVEKSSFGYKLLSTFGWKEGDGLGARRQGIKEHIKVKKKFDALGVGAAEQGQITRDWTTGMVSYDMILSGLKEISSKPAAASSSDTTSTDASSSDDGDCDGASSPRRTKVAKAQASRAPGVEPLQHTVIGAAAKRAKRPAEEESSSDEELGDGGSVAEAARTAGKAATTGAPRARQATHIGRYRRRENAKRVHNYSAADLAAILGANGAAPGVEGISREVVAGARLEGIQAPRSSGSDSGTGDAGPSGRNGGDGGSQGEPLRPSTPLTSELPVASPSLGAGGGAKLQRCGSPGGEVAGSSSGGEHDGTPMQWWGRIFVRGGRVGSNEDAVRQGQSRDIKAAGFSENDQTNLYMQTHDGATQGKQGLGRSSMPKKVAGARWQGTKTRLGDSSDEEGEQQPVVPTAVAGWHPPREEALATDGGVVIVLPKRRKGTSGQAAAAAGACTGATAPAVGKAGASIRDAAKVRRAGGKGAEKRKGACPGKPADLPQSTPAAAVDAFHCKAGTASKRQKASAAAHATAFATGAAPELPDPAARALPSASPAAQPSSMKWRKLARQVLKDAPKRRLRAAKLHKRILQLLGSDVSTQMDGPGGMLRVLRKASAKFQVTDTHVKLAAE